MKERIINTINEFFEHSYDIDDADVNSCIADEIMALPQHTAEAISHVFDESCIDDADRAMYMQLSRRIAELF